MILPAPIRAGPRSAKESDNPSDSEWAEVEFMQQVMPFNMVLHEVYSTAESMYLVMPMLPNGRLKDWLGCVWAGDTQA